MIRDLKKEREIKYSSRIIIIKIKVRDKIAMTEFQTN